MFGHLHSKEIFPYILRPAHPSLLPLLREMQRAMRPPLSLLFSRPESPSVLSPLGCQGTLLSLLPTTSAMWAISGGPCPEQARILGDKRPLGTANTGLAGLTPSSDVATSQPCCCPFSHCSRWLQHHASPLPVPGALDPNRLFQSHLCLQGDRQALRGAWGSAPSARDVWRPGGLPSRHVSCSKV